MPLAFRTIQPMWLGRRSLTEEEKKEGIAPTTAVCHNACLGAIVQLASLVRHADDLFCDLAEECQRIFEKTESISNKIQNVERIITHLDSTEVKIPVGTLKQFSAVTDHHVAKHGFDCDHFTPANRPYCIRFNYSMSELTPVHALRGVDPFRKDGLCSSHLFKLWPIALKDTQLPLDDMNIPRRYSSPLAQKKRYKVLKLKDRRRTIHIVDEISHEEKSAERQTGRGENLSKSQPSIMVAVDTSGSGFERMAMFRQSLSGDSSRSRIKRRRRTVSGVPDTIMQEIEQFEQDRRISRDAPRKYSLDDLDPKELDARDEIMQQYLLEIDSAIAEREEEEYAERREAKLFKFIPCRRSRSLPRCVKIISSRGHDELTLSSVFSKKAQQKVATDDTRLKQSTGELSIQDKFSSSASLGSLNGEDSKPSSSSRRSSLLGSKIKSLVSGTLRPRPKSLDFDSIEVKDESSKQILIRSEGRSSSLSRVSSPNMPEGALTRTTSNESQVGPGSYYYFDSNTLPRAQAKKYDFPWDSLPKDWTTSVKLREISKRRKEDRQSSSGNWSQSGYSSNRQSLDSDAKSSKPSSSLSQYSLGKDSGRDSPRSTADRDGLDAGYMGDAASTESISDTKSVSNTDSEEWIRSLAEQAANRGDVTCTSAEALASLSRLTKQNIRNLDILVPGRTCFRQKRNDFEDDGESSVYSIDQEGFYTSFHSDSGLKRSTNNLVEDEDDDIILPRVRETKSMLSMPSCTTVKSSIFGSSEYDLPGSSVSTPNLASLAFSNTPLPDIHESDIDFPEFNDGEVEYGDSGTLKAKKKANKKKKLPPLPPPRTTSINRNDNNTPNSSDEGLNSLDDSPTNSIETSSESSDHETIYARLKMKTSISAHTYPSWCVGIASDEDDFQERLNAESSEVEELFSGKDNWLSGTLPRISINSGSATVNETEQTTNSWPRVKRLNPQQPGILKTQEKDKTRPIPSNTKVLNFDPVVNLFDASSPHGVQMPLSRLSSSDESSSPGTSTFEAHPLNCKLSPSPSLNNQDDRRAFNGQELSHKEISSKFQPTITAKSGSSRPRSMVLDPRELTTSSTPAKKYHSELYSGKAHFNTSYLSEVHSGSNPSIDIMDSFDAPLTAPLMAHDKSDNTFTSNSTIGLSDIDSSSLTNVTMSDSSLTGSSLSLNWDTDDTPNPTPMATPVRKHAPLSLPCSTNDTKSSTGRISSVVRGVVQSATDSANSAQQLNVPSLSDQALTSSSNQDKEHGAFQHIRPSNLNSGFKQTESGHVSASSHPPAGSSIICQTLTKLNNVSSSSALSHAKDSDGNNNRNKITNITISDSTTLQPDFWKQSTIDQNDFHPNISVHSSLPQSHICTNAPTSDHHLQQMKSSYRSSHGERRRSAPTMVQAKNSSSSSSISGNEDSSGFKSSSSINSVKRRQSDNHLYSPADSGYGSPSVSNQQSMNVQTFSYQTSQSNQQYYSVIQPQINSSSVSYNSSLTTPLLKGSKSAVPDLVTKPTSANVSSTVRSDYPTKVLRQHSNQSNESLNSQFSISSTKQLISKMPKTDLSHPTLQRENSSESVQSNGSGGRSDSYRVAMQVDSDETSLIPNTISNMTSSNLPKNSSGIYRSQLSKSAPYADDVVSRADSYRCAVRNTQSLLLGDAYGRNTSYRLATCDEDVVITNSRMDGCNLWTGKAGATRDVRRMGITDVDQLKQYSSEPDDNGKSGGKCNMAKISNTPHAKKIFAAKTEAEGLLNSNKPSTNEHKKFMKSSSKDKAKQKTQSSTYIRFDPIFESGEDLRASNESLRPPSIISIRTLAKAESNETLTSDNTHLIRQRLSSTSPSRKRSGSHGRKDDKSSLSIFGSLKTTIKSIGGTKGE